MGDSRPLNRFTLTTHSIIDCIFMSQNPKRPAYATTTTDATTTLWTINQRGKLLEVARINWLGDASNRFQPMVIIQGQSMLIENILPKKQSMFRKPIYTFAAGTVRCRWKRTAGKTLGEDFRIFLSMTTVPAWICETIPPPGSSEDPRTIAALFAPHIGPVKGEIVVFPNSFDIIDHVVLTAILLTADKNEWRISQSALSHAALQASLKAEMRGTLPPYTPSSDPRYRPPSADNIHSSHSSPSPTSPSLRRPQSASVVRSRLMSGSADYFNSNIGRVVRRR